jgi:hypothetical protein
MILLSMVLSRICRRRGFWVDEDGADGAAPSSSAAPPEWGWLVGLCTGGFTTGYHPQPLRGKLCSRSGGPSQGSRWRQPPERTPPHPLFAPRRGSGNQRCTGLGVTPVGGRGSVRAVFRAHAHGACRLPARRHAPLHGRDAHARVRALVRQPAPKDFTTEVTERKAEEQGEEESLAAREHKEHIGNSVFLRSV